jgi:desampylase
MLILPAERRNELLAAARAAFPAEACGLLIGKRDGATVTVTALHPAANVAPAPCEGFAIDPAAQFSLQRALRGTGRAVVGCFHSHPNGRSEPSLRDRANGSAEGFVWIIVATGDKDTIAAFEGPSFQPLILRA